jgi:hypothetical protein
MRNLENYNNNGGYSWDNNFISNSFNFTRNSITDQFSRYYTEKNVAATFEKAGQSIADIAA